MLDVHLTHRFAAPGGAGFALDLAFQAPAAGVTALFGPSGCGKSTVLSALAGLLRPQAGRVVLGGQTLLDTAAGVDLPPERRRCGVVFQDARLFPHRSVEANLRYGLQRAPAGAGGPTLDEVVALLGLAPLLARRPLALSGGEKQRVALGRALLSRPDLLLMDEPLAALDTTRRTEVLPFLSRLCTTARLPVVYVTHALDEVDALADHLVLLQAGRVLAQGGVEALSLRSDLPLAARRDAGALLRCSVQAHDAVRGLTRLAFDGGALEVPLRADPLGTRLRIRLRARDIAVARQAPRQASIHNVLPCRLAAIETGDDPHERLLRLQVGPTSLLARVLRDTVGRLVLAPGDALFALVKGIALEHTPVGAPAAAEEATRAAAAATGAEAARPSWR
jgi:molybdate transport system ATP-binding protein